MGTLFVLRMSEGPAACPLSAEPQKRIPLEEKRLHPSRSHIGLVVSREEGGSCKAPQHVSRPDRRAVSTGTKGQTHVLSGQVCGIPTPPPHPVRRKPLGGKDDASVEGRRRVACWWRRVHRGLSGDRGAVTVELVIATPLLLFALLAIIQFVLWSHATHVAQAASAQALASARVQDGAASAGRAAGQRLLDDLAHGPLQNSRLDVARSATEVTVSIRGEATPVVPGLHLHVHAEASGAVERFVSDIGSNP